MPVPTSITDLSTTAASNSPAGVDAVFPDLDNYLRAHASFIAQVNADKLNKAGGTMTGALTLNAAPTVDLHASTKKYVDDGLASHTHAWAGITNKGLAEGANTQDPNSTQSHVILTNHANTPDAGTSYWHITTTFYSSTTGNRAQIAVQYSGGAKVYARSYYSGDGWQPWVRCDLGEVASSFLLPGYVKLPGGVVLQWGFVSLSDGGSSAITFPLTFPNACRSVQMTISAASASNRGIGIASSVTASGFTARLYNGASNTADLYWFAIGF